jgi:uncharacterized protein
VELSNPDFHGAPPIDAYGDGGFRLDKKRIEGSMILLPDEGMFPWPVKACDEMLPDRFDRFARAQGSFDFILIGTGSQICMPPRATRDYLASIPLQFDVMDTGAACRTYNVLLAENRRIAAALLCVS